MNQTNLKPWALITGSSSGMGVDYAHILANMSVNLVLSARRKERLEKLKILIEKKYDVQVIVIVADLGEATAPQNIFNQCESQNIKIDYLINNAGLGMHGFFADQNWSDINNMLMVDIMSLTELTKIFVDDMKKRNKGNILLIASVAAYQPCPTYAVYGAAKAYVLNFGEALNRELKDTNVSVSVLSPGATKTAFFDVSGQDTSSLQKYIMMDSNLVAKMGIKGVQAKKQVLFQVLSTS
jgi:uncharacterized protein